MVTSSPCDDCVFALSHSSICGETLGTECLSIVLNIFTTFLVCVTDSLCVCNLEVWSAFGFFGGFSRWILLSVLWMWTRGVVSLDLRFSFFLPCFFYIFIWWLWCFKRLCKICAYIFLVLCLVSEYFPYLDMADCLGFIGLGLAGGGGIIFDFQSGVDVLVLCFT